MRNNPLSSSYHLSTKSHHVLALILIVFLFTLLATRDRQWRKRENARVIRRGRPAWWRRWVLDITTWLGLLYLRRWQVGFTAVAAYLNTLTPMSLFTLWFSFFDTIYALNYAVCPLLVPFGEECWLFLCLLSGEILMLKQLCHRRSLASI